MKLKPYELAKLDCSKHGLNNDIVAYASANAEVYSLLIDCWLCLGDHLDAELRPQLEERITQNGLIDVIGEMNAYAKQFLASSRHGHTEQCLEGWIAWFPYSAWDKQEFLEFLRFPKRFSPSRADNLQTKGVRDYFDFNRSLRTAQRSEHPWFVVREVNRICRTVMQATTVQAQPHSLISQEWEEIQVDELAAMLHDGQRWVLNGTLNTGSTADAGKSIPRKVAAIANTWGNYWGALYPLLNGIEPSGAFTYKQVKGASFRVPAARSKIVAVEKDYSKPRIIGESESWRLFEQDAVVSGLRRAMKAVKVGDVVTADCPPDITMADLFIFNDQTNNRELARLGAKFGNLATIDLSSASDSISASTMRELGLGSLAYWLPDELEVISATPLNLPNTRRVGTTANGQSIVYRSDAEIALPSGERLTFPTEALIFLAVCLVARDVLTSVTGEMFELPSVYGDDLIVDVRTFELVCDFLESLGFQVNTDKSYAEGLFRESCGGDYYGEEDVSSLYWPRKTMDLEKEPHLAVASLVELERSLALRLGRESFPLCRRLASFCRKYVPSLTGAPLAWNGEPFAPYEGEDLLEPNAQLRTADPPSKKTDAAGKRVELPDLVRGSRRYCSVLVQTSGNYPKGLPHGAHDAMVLDCDMYRYVEFLLHGPRYEEPLLELLGISQAPTKVDTLLRETQQQWVIKRI